VRLRNFCVEIWELSELRLSRFAERVLQTSPFFVITGVRWGWGYEQGLEVWVAIHGGLGDFVMFCVYPCFHHSFFLRGERLGV